MSIIENLPNDFPKLEPLPNPFPQGPDIVPFTVTWGAGLMGLVEQMRRYMSSVLVPYVNANLHKFTQENREILLTLITKWDQEIADLHAAMDGVLEDAQAAVIAAQAARDLAEIYASQAEEIQDQAIAGIAGRDDSQTRTLLDGLYASIGSVTDIATVIQGRLSQANLDSSYAGKSVQETVEDGRLSVIGVAEDHGDYSGISVMAHGAVGDGVANDTEAIKNAIAAALASRVKRLIFPSGTYRTTEEIFISARLALIGYGYSTIIDAREIPTGAAAIRFGGATENVGSHMEGFDIMGKADKSTDGIYLGNRSGLVAVTDFSMRNVRVRDFRVGIPGRYVWDADFSNIRVHSCGRPIEWGPQFNSVRFNGAFSSFTQAAVLSNCETIHFDTLDVVNYVGEFHAFNLFQSHAIFTTPYIENLARFAGVGGATESVPSSMIINGGRVTGNIQVAKNVGLAINLPWVVERGVEQDAKRLTVGNDTLLSAAIRRFKVDRDQNAPRGFKSITRWKGDKAFPYPSAYGGAGITSVAREGYYEVTSPAEGQGFLVTNQLQIGRQYVLSYRIRKSGGAVYLRNGSLATVGLSVVDSDEYDFETLHIPFIANETAIRVLFGGVAAVQYISLTEGLVVREFTD